MAKAEILIPLRITVVDPPAGVLFAIQKGKSEVVTPILANGSDLSFDFSIRVQERADGSPNFLGPFVQGPTSARFVYVNSGTLAGQWDSCWTRRAKVGLREINWKLIKSVTNKPGGVLEVKIFGKTRDGGPVCASVKPLTGWTINVV
ncbi:MAG TPA: DUF5990 family protein [Pyrinomonadaceae bacterium]|jgi:hypothetical protein|nr:DUF5990 family protein [Pyrinomonadaceae bacterium]